MNTLRKSLRPALVGLPFVLAVGSGASMPMSAAAPVTPMDQGWETTARANPLPRLRVHPAVVLPGEQPARHTGPRFSRGSAMATPLLPQDRGCYGNDRIVGDVTEAPIDLAVNTTR
jgi:hypothetical protein